MAVKLDTIVSLCKRRGFIFPGSEIYGGLAATYDYGPLGVELKRNVKDAWWRSMVQQRDDMEGLDASILMHPEVWRASGHVGSFTDPMVDCKNCKKRFRADHLNHYEVTYKVTGNAIRSDGQRELIVGDVTASHQLPGTLAFEYLCRQEFDQLDDCTGIELIRTELLDVITACPECGQRTLTEPRLFNLMFVTNVGPLQQGNTGQVQLGERLEPPRVFLRPETAQGIFVNFDNVLQTMRRKLPFGIAQIGKSFRNEVTTKAFIFRTLEFEQMEIEYFVKPGDDARMHNYWITERVNWYRRFGIRPENIQIRPHEKDELAHYARGCADIEYRFPMGWSELEGVANRADYDLKQHSKFSGKPLTYFDQDTKEHVTPYVIEPSAGVDRSTMAFLMDSYAEEVVNDKPRVVLKLHPALAPIKIAVFPLLKNRPELVEMAQRIKNDLSRRWVTRYDDTGAIGKLYRRQDEAGTPFCLTVDVQSLEDGQVTIRDRDTMEQQRISADRLTEFMSERIIMDPPRLPNAYE